MNKTLKSIVALFLISSLFATGPALASDPPPATNVHNITSTQTLTTTTLTSNATYTSPNQDTTTGQKFIDIQVKTNASGSFVINTSNDGTNFVAGTTTYNVVGGTNYDSGSIYVAARYWQLVYTNGSTAQTSFILTDTASQVAVNIQNIVGSSPVVVTQSGVISTVSCSTCLTTAGGQTISSSDTFSAGISTTEVTTTGTTGINLTNGTSNLIAFNTSGIAAPTFTTTSAGEKIQLYPDETSSTVDYGIGIASGTLWFSKPTQGGTFNWYGGNASEMSETGGVLSVGALSTNTIENPGYGTLTITATSAALDLISGLGVYFCPSTCNANVSTSGEITGNTFYNSGGYYYSSSNVILTPEAGDSVYLNYNTGTAGGYTFFCNGATSCPASIDSSGNTTIDGYLSMEGCGGGATAGDIVASRSGCTTGVLYMKGTSADIDYNINATNAFAFEGGHIDAPTSNISALGNIAPVYNTIGAAAGANMHAVFGTCSFSGVSCSVSISTSTFTAANDYTCNADKGTATTQTYGMVIGNKTASSFTIYTEPSTSVTLTSAFICWGY